jgi:hypothetical protein
MAVSLEPALIHVRRQVLVENAEAGVLGIQRYPVRLIPSRRLLRGDA